VIELFGLHCIGYVCVTQRKNPEEELLRALLGASKLLTRQPPLASISVPDRTDIGVRQPRVSERLTDLHLQSSYKASFNSLDMHFDLQL
jgi:hypothetical protein